MPDREPRYRYWGSQKPIAYAVADTGAKAGTKASMRIYGPVDSWGAPFGVSADEFSQALAALGDDVDTIDLHMHSVGGEVFEGLAIMNQLRQHKATVNLVVDGLAASIASVIAMGADTVAMAPGAQMMVHDASGICVGTATDMATMNARLESLSSNLAEIYAARAGGTADEWRTAMQPESWYKAQEAVDAGLADRVLSKEEAPPAPKAQFDLTVFAHAGRDHAPAPFIPAARATAAPQTPAEPPVVPPIPTEEADAMSENIPKAGLCKALGLAEDADEDTILDAIDARTKASQTTPTIDTAAVVAALEADGRVVVSKARLDALTEQASLGAQAHAKQLTDERDELIEAAMATGRISRSDASRAVWDKEFARDFATAKSDLESLPARFPVGEAPGHAGTADVTATAYTDEMAAQDAELFGLQKEAFLR